MMAKRTVEDVAGEIGISAARYEAAVNAAMDRRRRLVRLWSYYANPMRGVGQVTDRSERPYRQAQEWGIPARITGYMAGYDPLHDGAILDTERKEVVVENDIAWRIDTQVDYLFGRMPRFRSMAADGQRRKAIETLLAQVIANSGGIRLLQQIALIGAVYGWVDVAVTFDAEAFARRNTNGASGSIIAGSTGDTLEEGNREDGAHGEDVPGRDWPMLEMARLVSLQVIEPARTLLLADPRDAMRVVGYGQMYEMATERQGSVTGMIRRLFGAGSDAGTENVLELWTASGWWKWRDGELEASGGNSLGTIPVVHIQNAAVPFAYAGASDVEALMPLQDELNTRLSDRAHRIAMQSFKMYLGIGIPNITTTELPAPGRVWSGAEGADLKEFGGDASCAAEDLHIAEVREAMDKASGVPPVAAGAIRNRIGNLTSAAALRVTLMSLLARTERKRALYGDGLKGVCELALRWLDAAGVFATEPEDRQIEVLWPDPLPESNAEKLQNAKAKLDLGMRREEVMREIGEAAMTDDETGMTDE